MKLLRDLAVGFVASALVLILDRAGAFQAVMGRSLLTSISRSLALPNENIVALAAILVGLLIAVVGRSGASYVNRLRGYLRGTPKTRRISGEEIFPKSGRYEVHYPIAFSKPPYLRFKTRHRDECRLVEQRADGFAVEFKHTYALRVFEAGCRFRWWAEGPVRND